MKSITIEGSMKIDEISKLLTNHYPYICFIPDNEKLIEQTISEVCPQIAKKSILFNDDTTLAELKGELSAVLKNDIYFHFLIFNSDFPGIICFTEEQLSMTLIAANQYARANNAILPMHTIGKLLIYAKKMQSTGEKLELELFTIEQIRVLNSDKDINIHDLPKHWLESIPFAEALVKINGLFLEYFSNEIKNEKHIVLSAVLSNPFSLSFASDKLKDNVEIASTAIEKDGMALKVVGNKAKNNKKIVLKALKQSNGDALQFASENLRNDSSFLLDVVKKNKNAKNVYECASEELKNNEDFIIDLIAEYEKSIDRYKYTDYSDVKFINASKLTIDEQKNLSYIKYPEVYYTLPIPFCIANNPEFIIKLSEKLYCSNKPLKYASENLLNDKNFILDFLNKYKHGHDNFIYIPDSLRNNDEFMRQASRIEYKCMEFASENLKKDEKFILELINYMPPVDDFVSSFLGIVNEEVLTNFDIMMVALKKDKKVAYKFKEFIFPKLHNDRELAIELLKTGIDIYEYLSYDLKSDMEIIKLSIKNKSMILKYIPLSVELDFELIKQAIISNNENIYYLPEVYLEDICLFKELLRNEVKVDFKHFIPKDWNKDNDVIIEVLKRDWDKRMFRKLPKSLQKNILFRIIARDISFKDLSKEFYNNKEFMLEAIRHIIVYSPLMYASEALRADKEVVIAAVQQNGNALKFASEELRADKEVVIAAVQQDGGALEFASEELRADKEVVMAAVKQDGKALEYASEEFRADKEVVLAAVQNKGYALELASEELKSDRDIIIDAVYQNTYATKYASMQTLLDAVKNNDYELNYATRANRLDDLLSKYEGKRTTKKQL